MKFLREREYYHMNNFDYVNMSNLLTCLRAINARNEIELHPILWRPYQCSKSRGIEVQGREYVVVR